MNLTAEQKKKYTAALLLLLLVCLLFYNFFSGEDEEPTMRSKAAATPTPKPGQQSGSVVKVATGPADLLVTEPLDLVSMNNKPLSQATGRNIFIYPPPPTPTPMPLAPTPTPPPPPPITLAGLNPSGVIARTADFTLTVVGAKIPPDAKAILNGREYPTTFINEAQIKVAVPASAIAYPGALRVEVRSAQDASLYSNPLTLNVAEPPRPPYLYLGYIVKNNVHVAILKSEMGEEPLNVRKGDLIDKRWRVINITERAIELLDVSINVSHSIPFTS
jgi:hypothetical protein